MEGTPAPKDEPDMDGSPYRPSLSYGTLRSLRGMGIRLCNELEDRIDMADLPDEDRRAMARCIIHVQHDLENIVTLLELAEVDTDGDAT